MKGLSQSDLELGEGLEAFRFTLRNPQRSLFSSQDTVGKTCRGWVGIGTPSLFRWVETYVAARAYFRPVLSIKIFRNY